MPHLTFLCDRYQYPINELVEFSINCNTRVIVRGYCEISRGKITYYDRSDYYANLRFSRQIH